MSLQTRLAALITAVGADIKELQARTPTVLSRVVNWSNTSEPTFAIEWWNSGTLLAKLITMNPIVSSVVVNRSELWARVRSRDAAQSADVLIVDSDGNSDFAREWGPWTGLTFATSWGNYGSGEQNGQYRKSLDGKRVQVRGLVKITGASITLGGANATITTLPAGARPPASFYYRVYVNAGGTTGTMVTMGISSAGVMTLFTELTGRTLTYGSGTYVGLDGIEFSTVA